MELKEDADYYFIIAIIETNIIIKYDLLIYKCSKDQNSIVKINFNQK